MNSRVSVKNLILMTGSFCAFFIGAAFSSGREVLQFFAGYGMIGYLGLIPVFAIFVFIGIIIQRAAYVEGFRDPYEAFPYFCGKKLGCLFIWLLTIILIADIIMMVSSAGANLSEGMGLPNGVGRCVILVGALTVCLGLNRIVDIISRVGPFVAIFITVVAIIAIVRSSGTVTGGSAQLQTLDVYTGSPNIWVGCFKYAMYCALSDVPILVVCGMRARSVREVKILSVLQPLCVLLVCAVCITAQLKNMAELYDLQVPNLMLIQMYVPGLHNLFCLILLLCTYSSSTVMLWTLVRKFAEEGTKRYYLLTITIAVVTYVISGTMPFSHILNYVSTLGMFFGGVFFIALIVWALGNKRKGSRE